MILQILAPNMEVSQVLICQFSQHLIRLMKNFRQMRNTFLVNRFRHKLIISENSQNNSYKEKKKSNYS